MSELLHTATFVRAVADRFRGGIGVTHAADEVRNSALLSLLNHDPDLVIGRLLEVRHDKETK